MPLQRQHGYNNRSEVTSGQKYNGTDPSDTSDPVTSYDYDLAYDNIGNRLESSTGILPVRNYTTNDLNQYTSISDLSDSQHDADLPAVSAQVAQPQALQAGNLNQDDTEKTDHISQSTSYMRYTWNLDIMGMTPEQVSALKNAVSNSQKLQSLGTDCND